MTQCFELPSAICKLVQARNALRGQYKGTGLEFTFDGKLVGDIGEAIAAEYFQITLDQGKGIDGYVSGGVLKGQTVQVKATGTGIGPQFRKLSDEDRADKLIFLSLDFDASKPTAYVVYNGPEALVLKELPDSWEHGQRQVSLKSMKDLNFKVEDRDRVPLR